MSKTPSHIIQRQCIELQMPTRLPHLQIQDEAIALFKDVLRDRIGECLDRLFPGEELVQLDNVVIDLGRIRAAGWEEEFVARFVEEFELVLQSAQQAHAVEVAARGIRQRQAAQSEASEGERGPWAALSYFLTYGFLPWWHLAHDKSSIQDLVRALLADGEALPHGLLLRMQEAFAAPIALERLVHALPDTLLSALAKAMGRLSPQTEAATGALTRLLTLPGHGISRSAARIAVWQEILGGAPAHEPLLPADVLAAAIVHLADATEQTPEALLQTVAADDPQLSGAWLRDLAHVQAQLATLPSEARARAHSPALRRAAEALQAWLLQADAQLFDVDKALSLLRDLQAALTPGELRDALAQVIEQLNAARRQRPAAPLQVPSVTAMQRLALAMREEASHCPAPLLLDIQQFYLQISLLHTPEMQESLLAAPLQHLAMEIMRLRASAGSSGQGPYLQATARQLLSVLDARTQALAAEVAGEAGEAGDAPESAHLAAAKSVEPEGFAQSARRNATPEVLPAPSIPVTQAHASAWIATQLAEAARTALLAPASLNLAVWRAWFKALRSPELRPLLGHANWRDLLQAISELLGGQAPALQLRGILQLADTLVAAGPTRHIPSSTPATLRTALEELVQIGDAAGTPKEVAQVQARLRAIAGVLHDSAVAQDAPTESETPSALSWKAAWLPLKASVQALASFGSPALAAAGVSAVELDRLQALLGQVHPESAERELAGILGRLLDIRARVQQVQGDATLRLDISRNAGLKADLAADGLVSRTEAKGESLASLDHIAAEGDSHVKSADYPSDPTSDGISPAVQQRLMRFLDAVIALTASLELELGQQAAPIKTPARKQDWRKEWEALREWMDAEASDATALEAPQNTELAENEAVFAMGDAASISQDVLPVWNSRISRPEVDETAASIAAIVWADVEAFEGGRQTRMGHQAHNLPEANEVLDPEALALRNSTIDSGDPAASFLFISNDPTEISNEQPVRPIANWQPAGLEFDLQSSAESVEGQTTKGEHSDLVQALQTRRVLSSSSRQSVYAQPGAITGKAIAPTVLAAPHHAIQAAGVLVGLAEILAPAMEGGHLTDAQVSFWQAAPISLITEIVEGLRTGKLLRSEVFALEQQLQVAGLPTWGLLGEDAPIQAAALESRLNPLDSKSEPHAIELKAALRNEEIDFEAAESSVISTNEASKEDSDPISSSDLIDADSLKKLDPNKSDSQDLNERVHAAHQFFATPTFRYLAPSQALQTGNHASKHDSSALEKAATSVNPAEGDAFYASTTAHPEYWKQVAPRQLQLLAWKSPAEIRQAALEARADHVLLLLGELVTRLQVQGAGQEEPASISPATFDQVRLWTQQFPGQPLPKTLAKLLADALGVLRATVSAPAAQAPSKSESAVRRFAASNNVPAVPELEQAAHSESAAQPATQAANAIAAALPAPQPQWRAKTERLHTTSQMHQWLGPRPVTILPQRSFQARRAHLIAALQGLMQLPAPQQGLRRTLDPLTRQHKPAPAAPSLSDASRQQLAQAAQQAKSLLRESLPARMYAALRSLQSSLTGQQQSRPDLRAIQRISTQANALLQGGKGKSAPKEPEKELSIYVKNAGLVLLWPFIQRFFQNLGLVEGREFVSPDAHGRAVLFLQYLADPDPETAEHLLPLCKLLCGYPDDRPIALALDPTEEEIEQCEGLLATVPSHHPAMKNMRVDGFRTAWLQREGALKPRGDHYLLHVEKQAYDVLLEQLPWSIRVIRLPWMHTAILTEW